MASQQLNSQFPGCGKAYTESFKSNIVQHPLLERLYNTHTRGYSAEETAQNIIIIDKEGKAYMRHAEKICRKIKQCQIPFSPKASIWICRPQVYYLLLCFHKGNIKNRGHLKGAARQCNIPDPRSLSISEILIHLDACKKEYTFYQEHGQHFC
jgi:hypothetical protein